jgi:hypothetical protein
MFLLLQILYEVVLACEGLSPSDVSSLLQILYEVCLRVKASHRLMWRAGTCHALLRLISQPQQLVGFHRDRAAVALAHMASNNIIKLWLRVGGVGRGNDRELRKEVVWDLKHKDTGGPLGVRITHHPYISHSTIF